MTVRGLLIALVYGAFLSGCTFSATRNDDTSLAADESEGELREDDGLDPDLAEDELGAQPAAAGSVEITDLRYVASKNGGTVVVRATGAATYRIRETPQLKQVVVELANAGLPERLKRPYITTEFNQSITAINAYQDEGATTARFVVQLRASDRLRVEQRGHEIFIAPESGITGSGSIALSGAEIEDDSSSESSRLRSYGGSARGPARDGLPASGITLDDLDSTGARFSGKPISIEVRDVGVRDVISFIADQSGANLVASDEVKGEVTLKLMQVPWDQALLLVMKARQLGYVRQGNVLRIAPLEILQAETENARKVVEAQRLAEPLRVRIVPVSYGKVSDLATQVREFLSARGKIVADTRTSSVIITDIIENIERATNLIKALDIPPLQVQIEAKVVEAREGFSREIGIQWGASGGEGIDLGGDLTLTPAFRVNSGARPNIANFSGNLQLGSLNVLGQLDAQLGLLEQEDQAKVISAPKVVTMNNEVANIAQKTQIPIQRTVIANNTTMTTTDFKDLLLSLDVTPQITSDSDVIMQVAIKREFAGTPPQGETVAPIFTREAKTRVMVKNGQTAVIGGIYQSDADSRDSGVPLLKDIPIFGWLFRQSRKHTEKNELLLFLTPRILNSDEGVVKSSEL